MIHPLKRSLSASELAKALDLELSGTDAVINCVGSLNKARPGCLVFSKAESANPILGTTLIAQKSALSHPDGTALISRRPRRDFIRALLFLEERGFLSEPETPAKIHPTANIGMGAIIGPGCEIDEGVIIEPNVVIMNRTRIGSFSRVRANSTIGSDGFGFERDDDGTVLRFVHLGRVWIGCNVEIGANTCIARGTLDDTVIEDGAKIDNLVHIAHNVRIGPGAFVIAGAEVSGGCNVGKGAWVGPNACVREKVQIGNGAMVGIGATVLRSIPSGEVHVGNPARPLPKSKI